MSPLRRVHKTQSITQKTYVRLERAIAKNRLVPGQLLVIGDLAEELGVSRTPVREALLMLEKAGLVEVENGRMTVSGLSLSDLEEVFEFRQAIELFSVEKIIESVPDARLNILRDLLEPYQDTGDQADYAAIAAADLKFHRSLVLLAENSRMLASWDQMATQLQRFWQDGRANVSRIKSDINECLSITAAVEQRDSNTASKLLQDHLLQTKLSLADWQQSVKAAQEAA